jgi:XRE family transcriptional regulator, master regulator for biofilm formation
VAEQQRTTLQDRLRRERRRAGLSLARLAEETGMSKTYLLRLESDPDTNPSLDVLRRIADALDVTVADLIGAPATQFVPDDADVPSSLRVFADQAKLSKSELELLASIRWRRGETPQTPERWHYILNSLRASRELDPD